VLVLLCSPLHCCPCPQMWIFLAHSPSRICWENPTMALIPHPCGRLMQPVIWTFTRPFF
jgi:hypothetical protein